MVTDQQVRRLYKLVQTDYFLFANPDFFSGMSRVLDLGSTLNEYNSTFEPRIADYYALKSDWTVVGSDLQASINSHGQEIKDEVTLQGTNPYPTISMNIHCPNSK